MFFLFFLEKHCVFQAHFCGTRDLFDGRKHKSLWERRIIRFFTKIGFHLYTNSRVFWLSGCDAAMHRIHLQNNHIHQNTLISDTVPVVASAFLLCLTQLCIPEYKMVCVCVYISINQMWCLNYVFSLVYNNYSAAHTGNAGRSFSIILHRLQFIKCSFSRIVH